MGVFNRIILFLYTLCFGVLSLGIALLVTKVVPERLILNEYQFLVSQWQTGVVAGVLFLISLHLFLCSFSFKSHKTTGDVLVVRGRDGEVNVAMSALRDTIVRLSNGVVGVRESKVKTAVVKNDEQEEKLTMDIRLEIGQERAIGDISDEIRGCVGDYMRQQVGLDDFDIAIAVDSISSNVAVKKRKLR